MYETVCSTFKEVCRGLMLLQDDCEWDLRLRDDVHWQASISTLLDLVVTLLGYRGLTEPPQLWLTHRDSLAQDYLFDARKAICSR